MLICAHEMQSKSIYVLKWFEIYTRVLTSSTIVVDMPISWNKLWSASAMCTGTSVPLTIRRTTHVYRQMTAYANPAGRVVSSTKMAISGITESSTPTHLPYHRPTWSAMRSVSDGRRVGVVEGALLQGQLAAGG